MADVAKCSNCLSGDKTRIVWSGLGTHKRPHCQIVCACGIRSAWRRNQELALDSWNWLQGAILYMRKQETDAENRCG